MKKEEEQKKHRSSSHRSTHRAPVAVEEPEEDTHFAESRHHPNHRPTHPEDESHVRSGSGGDEDGERDKSESMEAPMHDEKIDDMFHSIMKLKKNSNNKASDSRKKRRQP